MPRVGRGILKNCSSDYSLLFDGIFLYCQYNYIESITTWFSWRGDVDSENIWAGKSLVIQIDSKTKKEKGSKLSSFEQRLHKIFSQIVKDKREEKNLEKTQIDSINNQNKIRY